MRLPSRQLRTLHLNAEPAHVRGVQQLTQLTSLVWAVDVRRSGIMFGELRAAFATCKAPPGLQEVEVFIPKIMNAGVVLPIVSTAGMVAAINALVAWLACAPVTSVVWKSHAAGPAAMKKHWLETLSESSSLRAVRIATSSAHSAPSSLLEMAREVAQRRGIKIDIDRA